MALMAKGTRVGILTLLMVLLFCIAETEAIVVRTGIASRPIGQAECDKLCAVRCSLHSRPNVCTRACGTCCMKCKCVPPGTSGNRGKCGYCYANMKTHGNKLKCP
ncbi:Gibberellin-regulated family protein [Thalictrum thalictroides]|uniref:Gibberellin-regulated family protein n=1 Tax=Thalictrum thalictroides TaxID=46969 RepID=A0A7J6WNF3_THATH|nr:Gibberellin-regulated family protein [Thalictrum thalictroides]